jgi:hypothetical protein
VLTCFPTEEGNDTVDEGVKIRVLGFRAASRASSGVLLLAIAAALSVLGCAGRAQIVRDDLTSKDLDALIDSDPARELLADLLASPAFDPSLTTPAPRVLPTNVVREHPLRAGAHWLALPEQARLRELSQEISLDFAALSFARALSADGVSRAVQSAFNRSLTDGAGAPTGVLLGPGSFPYTVLFAPSWMYRSHPETGADFAHQRRLLDRLGIANRLIATGESGSVEDNAMAIAAAVRAATRDENGLIVVSASKSGAEAALALSRVLAPKETARVVAWVNIVGALRGSPLADTALRPPLSWVARSVFWLSGWDWAGLTSMATGPSRERLRGARVPESITVVNVVAVPLSGTVGAKVWWGYRILHRHGPNDGVVLLADTVWPGGVNVVAIGPDHLFSPRENDAHSLALLRAIDVAVRLRRRVPGSAVAVGSEPRQDEDIGVGEDGRHR